MRGDTKRKMKKPQEILKNPDDQLIAVDLDGVLCEGEFWGEGEPKPKKEMIDLVAELYLRGMNQNKTIYAEIKVKPLSANVLWQGRRFKTPAYKNYTKECLYLLPAKKMVKGEVGISFVFTLRQPARCDLDNFFKAAIDILVAKKYFQDDRFVREIYARKDKGEENKITIKVYPYGEPK